VPSEQAVRPSCLVGGPVGVTTWGPQTALKSQ
jgi:hypothetical protein